MDAPSEDIAEQRDAEVGLDDPAHGRGDHVRRRRGDLDRDEAGDADEEAEDALAISSVVNARHAPSTMRP